MNICYTASKDTKERRKEEMGQPCNSDVLIRPKYVYSCVSYYYPCLRCILYCELGLSILQS